MVSAVTSFARLAIITIPRVVHHPPERLGRLHWLSTATGPHWIYLRQVRDDLEDASSKLQALKLSEATLHIAILDGSKVAGFTWIPSVPPQPINGVTHLANAVPKPPDEPALHLPLDVPWVWVRINPSAEKAATGPSPSKYHDQFFNGRPQLVCRVPRQASH